MTPEERLAELGIELPPVAAPVAAYAPALRSGSYVYTSGQLPLVGGQLDATGKVGAEVGAEQAKQLAATCALNVITWRFRSSRSHAFRTSDRSSS